MGTILRVFRDSSGLTTRPSPGVGQESEEEDESDGARPAAHLRPDLRLEDGASEERRSLRRGKNPFSAGPAGESPSCRSCTMSNVYTGWSLEGDEISEIVWR